MAKVGVAESCITTLGILKAAGALGLLVGIGAPAVGIAAAVGLVLFFVGAIITHLRERLLVRPRDRVPSPGGRRARAAPGFEVKQAI